MISPRTALSAALLTCIAPLSAQTPAVLRWDGAAPAQTAASGGYEAPAQPLPYRTQLASLQVQPPARGFDVARFEAMASELTIGQRVPGLAMAIVQDGRVLSARGYGVTDVVSPQAVDGHTVFRLASLSKAFAGTVTGLLVNDGTLRWDSKVDDYVADFRLSDPYATAKVTVADLLSHRVGLKHYNSFDRDIEAYASYQQVTHKLADAPLACAPGDCYAYQNVAFSLIGDVVREASGQSYEQLVQQRLFAPLGMRDASLGLAGIEHSRHWAKPHSRSRNGWVSLMPKPTYYRLPPAAGVNASASDMAQWLLAQTGHRTDVLPLPLLATLHAPVIATPGQMGRGWRRERIWAAGYGLGWRVFEYAGHPVVFHAGAVEGYRSLIALVPERDLGVALMWNGSSSLPSGLLPTILDRAFGLQGGPWLDVLPTDQLLLAGEDKDENDADAESASPRTQGSSSSKASASPE
ncbi:serine hydrolase [Pseudoxanthomonas kalamensis DSM 18571]|uniref:serine hydrolase domain-containing protein n=1 Tax=Pseudoxanthomonas kalamensis TaxID=289483 RepID=UPI001390CEC1|nr:serine hydrolase domain-containing protein [Pseudoxanthomonas kalamensis]KAF1711297.1 serine hydrolase [Pseudoxanthomonas kalamensis DSM 18571]